MQYEIELDTILEDIVADWDISGLGVGVVENGEISYARYFGVQSLETGVPISSNSLFCVASIAKCFVASAVMQLAEHGKLNLDEPLVTYLPDIKLIDEHYSQITIRQMLSHTSGMPDFDESEYDELVANPESDEAAPTRFVRSLASRQMIATPGERFAYSNIAYDVLGHLIATLSGQTFEAYMKENILAPAGMPSSTFFYPEVPQDKLAVPHLRVPRLIVNPVYPYHRADAPASFLHSTVTEMCHWAITCLNGGRYGDQRILTPASYERMWMPVTKWGWSYPPFYEHTGLGWTLGNFNGVKTVSHGGMGFGWSDFFVLLPEKKSAAVILCNQESSAREVITRAIISTLLGDRPRPEPVSWMVPITQALQEGGLPAAYACYAEIKDSDAYFFDDYELSELIYQIQSVKKIDLAINVLEMNIHAFPEHIPSYLSQANFYLQKGERERAEEILRKAQTIQPDNEKIAELLEKIPTVL